MSHFTMMSSQQRKMQAAAICREVQGSNDGALDVGRKVSAPKEIMLEELSLSSNRGSRLFKMRQRRSEKYTFESVQSEDGVRTQNGIAPQTQHAEDGKSDTNSTAVGQLPKTALDPEPGTAPDPENIAPGYGGPLKDVPPEKFNSTAVPRSYCSPWDQALLSDPILADTLLTRFPVLEPRSEIPEYKSFNRVATPFGGFDKAPRIPAHKPAQTDLLPDIGVSPCPEVQDTAGVRPTFNRTAMGWIADTAPPIMPTVILEPMLIPESDEL
ncbi:myozenin-2-like [Scleropages formosus]|uniref:Myozenin 2a n=1 Tax=Scleropages formosus TaxID=113540 RepID=A0A8C9S4F5_SCLFO|nr:myozenin-2-like [Scleropages formosus]